MRFHRFSEWSPVIDDAMAALRSHEEWPSDLYRLLVDRVPRGRCSIVLCTLCDAPAGVVALTLDRRGTWEPVTHWILPGWIGPMRSSMAAAIAAAIPVRSRFAWWRISDSPPPHGGNVRKVSEHPTHCMGTSSDYEAYWRGTGQIRSVLKARARCAGMRLAINQPGAANWVIARSDELWRGEPTGATAQMTGRMVVADYLQPRGGHFTLTLQDGDRWVAGDTYLVHRGDLVALSTFRERDYGPQGVGIRLLDLGFSWAREMGFGSIDIGGGYSYKKCWAPPMGTKRTVLVSPLLSHLGHCTWDSLSSMSSSLSSRIGKVRRRFRGIGTGGSRSGR